MPSWCRVVMGAFARDENFSIFVKLVSLIASKISRTLIEHIDKICNLESGLSFSSIYSVENLDIFEVIAKTSFFQNSQNAEPCSKPSKMQRRKRRRKRNVVRREIYCVMKREILSLMKTVSQ